MGNGKHEIQTPFRPCLVAEWVLTHHSSPYHSFLITQKFPKHSHPCLATKPTSVFCLKTHKNSPFCGTQGLTTVQCTQLGTRIWNPISICFALSSLKSQPQNSGHLIPFHTGALNSQTRRPPLFRTPPSSFLCAAAMGPTSISFPPRRP